MDASVPEVHERSLRGHLNRERRSAPALGRAIEDFEHALALEPAFAPALAGLAGAIFERDVVTGNFGASRERVTRLARRAIQADPTLAEAHLEMGRVLGMYEWNWGAAEAAYRRAIELKPTLGLAYSEYSFLLQAQARFEEAVAQIRKATTLDPRSALFASDEGRALFRARRFSEAETQYERALALDPGFMFGFGRLADLYLAQHRFTEARTLRDRLAQVPPRRTLRNLELRLAAPADRPIPRTVDRRNPRQSAASLVARGDHDQALAALEHAVAERRMFAINWADPDFDPLRANPRFARLIHRMHLPVERLLALGP
jgi:serine/threonine-protein kinase